MQLVSGKIAVQRVGNILSEKHQVHAYAVDLTARQIFRLDPTGTVDFGGSEYVAAERHPMPTHQKHSQDRYQWWTLPHGAYMVEFNETVELAEDEMAVLAPHERLLREEHLRFLLQSGGVAFAARDRVRNPLQRLIEHDGNPPFIRTEQLVARAECEAIRLAHGRHGTDEHGQIQVRDHAPDDRKLLGVLLAEVGDIRLHDMEKLRNHCRDAAEVPGTKRAAQTFRNSSNVHAGA